VLSLAAPTSWHHTTGWYGLAAVGSLLLCTMALLSSAAALATKGADVHSLILMLIVSASTLCVPFPAHRLGRVCIHNPFEFVILSDNGFPIGNHVLSLTGVLLEVKLGTAAAKDET
jgi:hypothetical protein